MEAGDGAAGEVLRGLIDAGILKPVWRLPGGATLYAIDYHLVYRLPKRERRRLEELLPFRDRHASVYKSRPPPPVDTLPSCGGRAEFTYAIVFTARRLRETSNVRSSPTLRWRFGRGYLVRGEEGLAELAGQLGASDTSILTVTVFKARFDAGEEALLGLGFRPARPHRILEYMVSTPTRVARVYAYLPSRHANIYNAESPEVADRIASFIACAGARRGAPHA